MSRIKPFIRPSFSPKNLWRSVLIFGVLTTTLFIGCTVFFFIRAEPSVASPGIIDGSGTATEVAFFTGPTSLSSDPNLYWDNTNKRLGIGTTGPEERLEVNGNFGVSGNSNTCHLVSYSSVNGTTDCPSGYFTWAGQALVSGTMLCCKVDNPL